MRFFKFTVGTDETLEKYVGKRLAALGRRQDPGSDINESKDDGYWGFDYDKDIKITNEAILEESYGLDYFVNFSTIGKKEDFSCLCNGADFRDSRRDVCACTKVSPGAKVRRIDQKNG